MFTTEIGTPLEPYDTNRCSFKPLLKEASIPSIRFRDLRHICLSLLTQRGEPIHDLQALGQHATAAFALRMYTHHYDSSARRTADVIGYMLPEEP